MCIRDRTNIAKNAFFFYGQGKTVQTYQTFITRILGNKLKTELSVEKSHLLLIFFF